MHGLHTYLFLVCVYLSKFCALSRSLSILLRSFRHCAILFSTVCAIECTLTYSLAIYELYESVRWQRSGVTKLFVNVITSLNALSLKSSASDDGLCRGSPTCSAFISDTQAMSNNRQRVQRIVAAVAFFPSSSSLSSQPHRLLIALIAQPHLRSTSSQPALKTRLNKSRCPILN